LGDGFDVNDEAGVRLPGSVGGLGDPSPLARQPDEGRPAACQLPAFDPARLTPAVAQPAAGAMAAADHARSLVDADRVLLRDQTQQDSVPLRKPNAAVVPPLVPPPTASRFTWHSDRAHLPPFTLF